VHQAGPDGAARVPQPERAGQLPGVVVAVPDVDLARGQVLGGVLVMLAGLLRDLTQLAVSPSDLTALATAVLAGAMFAAVLALLTSVASPSRTTAALPMIRRASALREKSRGAAFLRQRDPDAAGRSRPRAPSAAPAAARSR